MTNVTMNTLERTSHKPVQQGFLPLARGAVSGFFADRCTTLASRIAFYFAFSLAPTLLVVLAAADWFSGQEAAPGRLFDQIKSIADPEAAGAIQAMVKHAHEASGGGIAEALSLVFLLVGAS